jgi:hypothetical protein
MQRLEVSCAVRPIYGSLGAKGIVPVVGSGEDGNDLTGSIKFGKFPD